jgi:four helix bundle protein
MRGSGYLGIWVETQFLDMQDHRSLGAWQEAHAVALGVLRLSRDSWKPYAAALYSQLQRSSLSVELNIAEGYSFGNTPNYTRHLGIAYGSLVETIALLTIGMEAEVFPAQVGTTLVRHATNARRLLVGLLKRRRPFPGWSKKTDE